MSNESLINDIARRSEFSKVMSGADRAELRRKISMLEDALAKEPQADVPLKHYFSKDVYAREITIPKGTLIVGAIHKFLNMNIISKGDVSFFSIDGSIRAKAPHTFVASPGVKRVIFAHEETVWTTIHGTSEMDLKKIEDIFIAKNYDDVYLATRRTLDDVLAVLGFTAEQLRVISENPDDQIPFPDGGRGVRLLPSSIHGKGIFAARDFVPGETIQPARLGGMRTPAGRYTNHSGRPNAAMVFCEGDVYLVATEFIADGREILTDYYFNYMNTRG